MMGLVEELRLSRLPSPAASRAIRLAAGISQARIATELGVHRVTLARWETGRRRPRGGQRLAYAELLRELQVVASGGGS